MIRKFSDNLALMVDSKLNFNKEIDLNEVKAMQPRIKKAFSLYVDDEHE